MDFDWVGSSDILGFVLEAAQDEVLSTKSVSKVVCIAGESALLRHKGKMDYCTEDCLPCFAAGFPRPGRPS